MDPRIRTSMCRNKWVFRLLLTFCILGGSGEFMFLTDTHDTGFWALVVILSVVVIWTATRMGGCCSTWQDNIRTWITPECFHALFCCCFLRSSPKRDPEKEEEIHMRGISGQLMDMKREKDAYEEDLNEFKQLLMDMKREKDAYEEDLNEFKQLLNQNSGGYGGMGNMQGYGKNQNTAMQQLRYIIDERDRYAAQLNRIHQQPEGGKGRYGAIGSKADNQAEQQLRNLTAKLNEVQQKLNESEGRYARSKDYENMLIEAQKQLKDITRERDTYQKQLYTAQQQLKHEKVRTEEVHRHQAGELGKLQQKASASYRESNAMNKEYKEIKGRLDQVQQQLDSANQEKELLKQSCHSLTAELESNKQKLNESEGRYARSKDYENMLIEAQKQLKHEKVRAEEVHRHQAVELGKLQQKASASYRESDPMTKEYKELKGRLDQVHQIVSANQERDWLNQRCQSLTTDLESNKQELASANQERQRLNQRCHSLAEELESNKQQVEKKNTDLENLQRKYATLEREVEKRTNQRLGIFCTSAEKLHQIFGSLHNMKRTREIPEEVELIDRRLTKTLSASKEDIDDVKMILLVAVAESRNRIILDSEPSQLGPIYRVAVNLNRPIFMIFVDNKYPDSLKEDQAYHSSVRPLLGSQRSIGDLAQSNRFISVKYKEKENAQKLNSRQSALIHLWVQDSMKE